MRMRYVIGVVAISLALLILVACIPVYYLGYTCALCRLNRIDRECLGFTRSTYRENKCSSWYVDHIERSHEHAWEPSSCCRMTDLFGLSRGYACGAGSPIYRIPADTQLNVYRRFSEPLKAKAIFESMVGEKARERPFGNDGETHGEMVACAISEWQVAGFPGSWEKWWMRYYQDRKDEHPARAAWIRSGSGMSFQEWRTKGAKENGETPP